MKREQTLFQESYDALFTIYVQFNLSSLLFEYGSTKTNIQNILNFIKRDYFYTYIDDDMIIDVLSNRVNINYLCFINEANKISNQRYKKGFTASQFAEEYKKIILKYLISEIIKYYNMKNEADDKYIKNLHNSDCKEAKTFHENTQIIDMLINKHRNSKDPEEKKKVKEMIEGISPELLLAL